MRKRYEDIVNEIIPDAKCDNSKYASGGVGGPDPWISDIITYFEETQGDVGSELSLLIDAHLEGDPNARFQIESYVDGTGFGRWRDQQQELDEW